MLENIDRIKERIQCLNNGFKSLNKFSETKQGELFGRVMSSMQVKTASVPEKTETAENSGIISETALKELKDEIGTVIEKFSSEKNLSENSVKNAIASIIGANSKGNDEIKQLAQSQNELNKSLNNMLTMQYINSNSQLGNLTGLNSVSTLLNGINKK